MPGLRSERHVLVGSFHSSIVHAHAPERKWSACDAAEVIANDAHRGVATAVRPCHIPPMRAPEKKPEMATS